MLPSITSSHCQSAGQAINNKIENVDIKEITKQIEKIDQSIDQKKFFKENLSQLDAKLMPYWVDIANKNKQGLNLSYIDTLEEFSHKIKYNNGHNQRYIIRISDRGPHCAVIDVKTINGKPSILLFESAKPSSNSSGILAFNIRLALEKINLSDQFCVVDLDIQRNHFDCALFSLAIAKKIHKHENAILSLHNFIANNIMTKPCFEGYVRKHISDKFLPADFYKHTQSKQRIQEYLNNAPENKIKIINKKNETIIDIMKSRFVEINDNEVILSISKSIHLKRLTELKNIRDFVQN